MKQTPAVASIEGPALTCVPDDTALTCLPDDDLLRRLTALLRDSRRTEAALVAHVGEVDRRRLYAREACPSMFAFCIEVLHLSEHEAYLRITVARAARQHPELLAMLADGRLHLSGIAKLAPHLTVENTQMLLERATHRSKLRIEELLAELFPRPDAPALIRRLPPLRGQVAPGEGSVAGRSPSTACGGSPAAISGGGLAPEFGVPRPGADERPEVAEAGASSFRGVVAELGLDRVAAPNSGRATGPARTSVPDSRIEPLAPSRYRVQFTASAELRDKLARLRDLMRSSIPDGDLAAVIDAAVSEKLQRLEARRFARTESPKTGRPRPSAPAVSGSSGSGSTVSAPTASGSTVGGRPAAGQAPSGAASPASRHLPAAIRRAVHERDGGRCRYLDEHGRRCTARGRLEYHHRFPYARGGEHSVADVCLMCHAHNAYLAEVDFNPLAIAPRMRRLVAVT